ncbi:MAG: hypothetical protein HQM00_10630 [Magnetococcales bacterium]|nr:hypothetical protein [Magnetococcales bacterium]
MRQVKEQLQDGKAQFEEIKKIQKSLMETKQRAAGAAYTVRAVMVTVTTIAGLILGGLQFWKSH